MLINDVKLNLVVHIRLLLNINLECVNSLQCCIVAVSFVSLNVVQKNKLFQAIFIYRYYRNISNQ